MDRNKNIFVFHALLIFCLIGFSCTEDPITIPEPDTSPPQAIVLFPIDGEPISGEIIVQVRAVDNDRVDSVQFLINQKRVYTDSTQTDDIFKFTWDTEATTMVDGGLVKLYEEDQFHYISAIAFDPIGNSYASVPTRSKIDNIDNEPPNAFFLSPFAGQYVSDVVNIEVIATDNDSIQYVSYFINNVLQGYVQETPYLFPWNTNLVESGNYYSLHANVKDINNNTTTIAPISVFVDNGIENDVTPPTGSIVSPPAGLTVSGDVQIIISANDDRAMKEVALSIDGIYITTIEQAPFFHIWDTTIEQEDAEHTISVVLIDLAGNEAPLNPISVVVDNNPPLDEEPPIVMITDPVAGQTLSGMVNIEVIASDDTGIDHIEYFINGLSYSIDTIPPYVQEWNTETVEDDAEHIIAAVGYDIQGNATLATPIAVYIDNYDNIIPTGQIQNPVPGQTVNGTIVIEITAYDNVGVDNVELSIDGIPRDTLYDHPYVYNWDTNTETDDQDHVISALVSDTTGNIGFITPISVIVDNDINDITPPTGIISNPISGQTVNGWVDFTVLAQDDNGIAEVLFYIDGVSVLNDESFPYVFSWDTTSLENDSEHSLSASVTDNAGHTTIIQPVLVTVIN
ncbi:MAG: Ig-like domain-containing protein [Candidatus Marinimicrobia bacterium]|nr:Ig-like domain-containing protein [Candidatus Neomarinimicrobiota bacterium]